MKETGTKFQIFFVVIFAATCFIGGSQGLGLGGKRLTKVCRKKMFQCQPAIQLPAHRVTNSLRGPLGLRGKSFVNYCRKILWSCRTILQLKQRSKPSTSDCKTAVTALEKKMVQKTEFLRAIGTITSQIRRLSHRRRYYRPHVRIGLTTTRPRVTNVKGKDCAAIRKKGATRSGVYKITPSPGTTASVYCDMKTDGGGWTVFQRRFDGKVDFYKSWAQYKAGFGSPAGEYWLGNDVIHLLTKQPSELRVDLQDFLGKKAYAKYSAFSVGNSASKYKMRVSGCSGTAGDSLSFANGYPFSTKDTDNDDDWTNCAVKHHGAWWYTSCHLSNLNGRYYKTGVDNGKSDGIAWYNWKKSFRSLRSSQMMVRPKGFRG